MSEFPWQPGPWEMNESWAGGLKRGSFHIGRPNHAHVNGAANAALIQLAPEMAEAVLEAAREAFCVPEHKRCYAENFCIKMAMKLCAIGSDT